MDHRFGERVSLWAPAVIYTTNGCELDATALDISLSGLGLVINSPTDCPLEPFQRVMVDFEPLGPGAGTVVLNAHVARVAGDNLGLMFQEFQGDLMQQIAGFVADALEAEKVPLHPPRKQFGTAVFGIPPSRSVASLPAAKTRGTRIAIAGQKRR